jgi:hypothetical protein
MEAVRISPQLLAAAGSPTISFAPGDVKRVKRPTRCT